MTNLIFDSGPLINFAMNGILPLLKRIKKEFPGDFLITKEVKEEIIDRPQTIPRFKLGALQLKELFDEKIIKHANITNEQISQLREKRNYLMDIANSTFRARGKSIHLIDKGESAALALASILDDTILVIDERTTRMLCEAPENLKKLLEKKLKTIIKAKTSNYSEFKNFKIIRSTELIYIAYKKGLIQLKGREVYEAMLYGLKYKGCAISNEEISIMKNL